MLLAEAFHWRWLQKMLQNFLWSLTCRLPPWLEVFYSLQVKNLSLFNVPFNFNIWRLESMWGFFPTINLFLDLWQPVVSECLFPPHPNDLLYDLKHSLNTHNKNSPCHAEVEMFAVAVQSKSWFENCIFLDCHHLLSYYRLPYLKWKYSTVSPEICSIKMLHGE